METNTETAAEWSDLEKPPFCIDTVGRAEWLLKKLATIAAEKSRVKAQAAQIVAQCDNDTLRLEHLFGAQLQAIVTAELARKGGTRKSLALLQGTCAFRTVPGGLVIADEVAARASARQMAPDLLSERTVEDFDTAEYLKLAALSRDGTGELLPGVDSVPDRESFSIRFGKATE